jgi:DNA primase
MARIPDEQIARLKTEVSIVRLVEAAGIELKKHGGADLVGRCPFHDDRTPSLVVSPDKSQDTLYLKSQADCSPLYPVGR